MAWVHQYYICLNCNFKDKLCSLFLLPFHLSHSYIHTRVRLWQMLCLVPICVLTLYSLSLYPPNQFSLTSFLSSAGLSLFFSLAKLSSSASFSLYPFNLSLFLCFLLSWFHISCLSTFYPSPISTYLHTFPLSFAPPHNMSPTPHPSLAVYQASTLSSAVWLMLCRRHLSPQCHHSPCKIQSFSETALVHHLSSPPFWLWLRGTIGMACWRPA